MRARLIGPKPWNRVDLIFESKNGAARDCSTADWGSVGVICALDVCLVCVGPGYGHGLRVHKMNR